MSQERMQEIANRGLQDQLPQDKRAIFDEAVSRGLITLPQQQERPMSDKIIGGLETAATMASGMISEPAAGLAAIPYFAAREMGADVPPAREVVDYMRDTFTYQPKTEAGQEYVSGVAETLQPVIEPFQRAEEFAMEQAVEQESFPYEAALGVTAPTAALELTPVGLFKGAATAPARMAKRFAQKGAEAEADYQRLTTPQETVEQASQIIAEGDPETIAVNVQADPEFYKAADALGYDTEPLAAFASQNPQYRQIEMGLSSIPGSQLDAQGKAFIAETAQKADELITQYGGTTDKAELSMRFREDSLKSIDDIYAREGTLYDSIEASLPKNTRVEARNTLRHIERRAEELGGFANLPPKMKKLYSELRPKEKVVGKTFDLVQGKIDKTEKINPTHELLNQRRKEMGQQLGRKGDTQFKDMETGELKQLYAAMKTDQDAVASATEGLTEVVESANALTIQRKQIEDNLKSILGKDLRDDIMPKVGSALTQLQKGKIQRWKELVNQIPKEYRQEIVVSSLNDIFRGRGKNAQALDVTQFSKFMDDLNRSPATKTALYKELPKESRTALDNLYKVSKGISEAQGDKITTGRITALFDENKGLLTKLMGGVTSLAAETTGGMAGGMLGREAARIGVNEFLNQSTDMAKSADAVLASPSFQNMIKQAVKEGTMEGSQASKKLTEMEKNFAKTKTYQNWANNLSEAKKSQLASMGFLAYLMSEEE